MAIPVRGPSILCVFLLCNNNHQRGDRAQLFLVFVPGWAEGRYCLESGLQTRPPGFCTRAQRSGFAQGPAGFSPFFVACWGKGFGIRTTIFI